MDLKIINYFQSLMATCIITGQLLAMEAQREDTPSAQYDQIPSLNMNTKPQAMSDIQFKVGLSYYEGKSVPQNYNEAFRYFKVSADQGHPQAACHLACMYRLGLGVSKDEKEAFKYYKSAADQGDEGGECDLGGCYLSGIGVSIDTKLAAFYFKLSADKGNQTAQYNLGIIYTKGKAVDRDMNKAIKYYTMAAIQGNADAQYNLGLCYQYGQGFELDLKQAVVYYRQAAELGHLKAQASLLKLHKEGFYTPCNLPSASSHKEESSKSSSEPSSEPKNTNKRGRKNKKTVKFPPSLSKKERQKNLYKEVIKLLDVNPQGALILLREAEKDGCPDSKDYLSKLRKSKPYKNNRKNNPKSLGFILRSMESSNNESSLLHHNHPEITPQESLNETKEKKKTKPPVFATHNNTNSVNQIPSPIEETNTPINKENSSETKEENNTALISGEGPTQEALINPLNTETISKNKTLGRSERTLKRRNSENNLVLPKEKKTERKELKRSLTITDKYCQAENKKEEKSIKIKEKKNKISFRNNANPTRELKKRESERKLERKNSQSNLTFNNGGESETEQSAAEVESKNLYVQEGTRDTDLKKLKKLLNDRDLVVASDIKLTESLVRRVLRELSDKKVISWNFEKDKVKGDKITATHCQNQNISLTIHLHGMWWTRSDIKEGILNFIRRCDSVINDMILEIEIRNKRRNQRIAYF